MKRLIALLVSTCACALAQDYVVTRDVTLASSADAVTIQQPSSNSRVVRGAKVFIRCIAACDVTIEREGTAATTSAVTPVAVNPSTSNAAHVTAFVASDVGVGTVVARDSIPANGFTIFDMSKVTLNGSGTSKNFTIRIASMTGRVIYDIFFSEQ